MLCPRKASIPGNWNPCFCSQAVLPGQQPGLGTGAGREACRWPLPQLLRTSGCLAGVLRAAGCCKAVGGPGGPGVRPGAPLRALCLGHPAHSMSPPSPLMSISEVFPPGLLSLQEAVSCSLLHCSQPARPPPTPTPLLSLWLCDQPREGDHGGCPLQAPWGAGGGPSRGRDSVKRGAGAATEVGMRRGVPPCPRVPNLTLTSPCQGGPLQPRVPGEAAASCCLSMGPAQVLPPASRDNGSKSLKPGDLGSLRLSVGARRTMCSPPATTAPCRTCC